MEKDFYISLIYKQLEGLPLSAEEEQGLSLFLSKRENQVFAEEIKTSWHISQKAEEKEINLDDEFNILKSKIKSNPSQSAKVRKLPISYRYSAAAGLLILIAAAIFFFKPKSGEELLAFTADKQTTSMSLSDGSVVWLNKGSTLRYPKVFKELSRIVELEGEGFFEVEHNPAKPFIVKTAASRTEVLGTSFLIKEVGTEQVKLSVHSGKVRFSNSSLEQQAVLGKDQSAMLSISSKSIDKMGKGSVNELYFKTGAVQFSGQSFSDAIQELEDILNINIEMESEEMKECVISGVFNFKEKKELLDKISRAFKMKLSTTQTNQYVLTEGVCP